MLYALWRFALGEWTAAGLALGFAFALQALKTPIDVYDAIVARNDR